MSWGPAITKFTKANGHNTISTISIEHVYTIAKKEEDDHVRIVADQNIYAPAQETEFTGGGCSHFSQGQLSRPMYVTTSAYIRMVMT